MQLQSGTYLRGGKYTYRIACVLGQGGFGITYLAYARIQVQGPLGMIESDVKVAIKEFFMKDLCNREEVTARISVPSVGSRGLVDRFRKKFIKEANSIATLQHPTIIKVIDVFEENGTAYYVMEYVEGGSLQDWVKQRGALSEKEALGYICQVASALDYIHQRKMNHLDIKPANILCKPDGHIVLIDFGLSKQYDEKGEQTSSTPVGVSTGYAPAEQSKPGGVGQFSAPTDIYSLGATLFKLVTGNTPPDALDIINDGLSPLPGHLSASTGQAIKKSMEPGRRNRPQSIKEFLSILNEEVSVEEEEETKIDPVIPVTPIQEPSPVSVPTSRLTSKQINILLIVILLSIPFSLSLLMDKSGCTTDSYDWDAAADSIMIADSIAAVEAAEAEAAAALVDTVAMDSTAVSVEAW